MSDLNDIERQRWGGKSPWAGKDSRTEAQRNPVLNHGEFERIGGQIHVTIHTLYGSVQMYATDYDNLINGGMGSTLAIIGPRGALLGVVPLDKARRADLIAALEAMD